jgi:selenocysteine lyase/cysteine desulfurase
MDNIARHEHEMISYAMGKLKEVKGMKIYGPVDEEHLKDKVGVIAFELDGISHAKTAAILSAEGGIGVRNGCFCAHPYVMRLLQFDATEAKTISKEILGGDRSHLPGMVRASFGCYNNTDDVDRLIAMLHRIAAGDYKGDYVLEPRSGSYWPKNFEYNFRSYFPHFSFKHPRFAEHYEEAS